ncbi:hypothetical protein DHL47_04375 [Streptococcus panodentis]|uniref:Uncharacterized protein n=2 Tax=Streptococcus panodentis TaxID=1581472 RepID=A0ABS5AWG1_9STRE|nr:hypothetical protein [Streptococcus panodentis]
MSIHIKRRMESLAGSAGGAASRIGCTSLCARNLPFALCSFWIRAEKGGRLLEFMLLEFTIERE